MCVEAASFTQTFTDQVKMLDISGNLILGYTTLLLGLSTTEMLAKNQTTDLANNSLALLGNSMAVTYCKDVL